MPTLDDILDLPGNRAVFTSLVELLRRDRAIAFVGAGASAGMYPLWNAFIHGLADHAVAQGKATVSDALRWKADSTSTPQQRVNVIARKIGEGLYRNFIRETFGPRLGADRKRYTPLHAALVRLPFRGYVTTNCDPAMDFARMEIRPECLSAGTPTWQDDDEVHRWLTGDVFDGPDPCPMLWLHGFWQRPDGVVFNSGEYSNAYKPGIYRKTFERLWEQDHLVFAGFGFNDPQFTFMVGEILRDINCTSAVPRHVAILGAAVGTDGTADHDALDERRQALESDYHVRGLFYPAVSDDHSALKLLLDGLTTAVGRPIVPTLPVPSAPLEINSRWVHETSDDDKFTGRDEEISRLNRWVRDETVRAIGVSAVGGTGKTALVGHWLKNDGGPLTRQFVGLFAWSFYQNRDSDAFLSDLLIWAHEAFGTPARTKGTPRVQAVLDVMRRHSILVVLDGLEVLQEAPGGTNYGAFLDGELRDFVVSVCQMDHGSLAVLTSRFAFADLQRYCGTAFHQLELYGLSQKQGAGLLADLGVRGPALDREYVSQQLDGHALGLRIFADVLPDGVKGQPRRFLDEAFRSGKLKAKSPLTDRLRRLLVFYERNLPALQKRLLGIVSLFRKPVSAEAVLRLVNGLFATENGGSKVSRAQVIRELLKLYARGILTREPIEADSGYACHPILRDHFRMVLLGAGARRTRKAADLLMGQPSGARAESIHEIEPVLMAIDLLLEGENNAEAAELYEERLEEGTLFLPLAAVAEGLACAFAFVRDEKRRDQCADLFPGVAFYLNEVGLFSSLSGHYDHACRALEDAEASAKREGGRDLRAAVLENKAELLVMMGRLTEAQRSADEAVSLLERDIDEDLSDALAYRAWSFLVYGDVTTALADFAVAAEIVRRGEEERGQRELYGICGIWWADLLLRTGHLALATKAASTNLGICERNNWKDDVACCHRMLAGCALANGKLGVAERHLRRAEPVFRTCPLPFDLARCNLLTAEIAFTRSDIARALGYVEEALAIATSRGMPLVHADGLVQRGRYRLSRGRSDDSERARDDADEALRIAREHHYVWAERDALLLLADAFSARPEVARGLTAIDVDGVVQRARTDARHIDLNCRLSKKDVLHAEYAAKRGIAAARRL